MYTTNNNKYTIDHRLAMCKAFKEGCELEDAVKSLCFSIERLRSCGDDFTTEMVLLLTENICRDFVQNHLFSRCVEWEEYNEFPEEVYKHFTGGASKLTEKEYNS